MENRLKQLLRAVLFLALVCGMSIFTYFPNANAQSCGNKILEASEACDLGTPSFQQEFITMDSGGLDGPHGITFGPDGNLYVSSRSSHEVLRYDGVTGNPIDTFVTAGSGGLDSPYGITFGPDGNLYVCSYGTHEILRYNGATGDPIDVDAFVMAGSGGLDFPTDLFFGPFDILYVSSSLTDEVLRYDGVTGAFIDAFVTAGSGGLDSPRGITFGPDGDFYVSSFFTSEILRYNGVTGAFIDDFVSAGGGGLNVPQALVFGPDGNLYVGKNNNDEVLRYDGVTGVLIDVFIDDADGSGLVFFNGVLYATDDDIDGNRVLLKVLEGSNSNDPNATCRLDCTERRCGDGITDNDPAFGESCDDGNSDNTDACLDTCIDASCGDGYIHTGFEECDPAIPDGPACDPTTCRLLNTGDGGTGQVDEELREILNSESLSGGGCTIHTANYIKTSITDLLILSLLFSFVVLRFHKHA